MVKQNEHKKTRSKLKQNLQKKMLKLTVTENKSAKKQSHKAGKQSNIKLFQKDCQFFTKNEKIN